MRKLNMCKRGGDLKKIYRLLRLASTNLGFKAGAWVVKCEGGNTQEQGLGHTLKLNTKS